MDLIDKYFEKKLLNKKGTIQNFRSHIKRYFVVINVDMDTYFKTVQPYEKHIRKYFNYLDGKSPKYKYSGLVIIKGFLATFDRKTKDLEIWDTIKARMKGKAKPIYEKHVPDRDELRQILHYADMRTKTVVMLALTSGMRIGEVVQLLPQDIHMDEIPTRINIRAEITKTGNRRTTFISPEATELLKEWLRVKDRYIEDSHKSINIEKIMYVKFQKNDRIFPYHTDTIRRKFNKACSRAGYDGSTKLNGDFDYNVQRSRRKLTYHNLRAFFRTYFGNSDLAEHLMGHEGYLTNAYRQFNDKQLAKEYMNYVKNVTIFEREPDLTEHNKRISQLEKEKEEMQRTIMEMKAQITELRLEKLEKANGIKK